MSTVLIDHDPNHESIDGLSYDGLADKAMRIRPFLTISSPPYVHGWVNGVIDHHRGIENSPKIMTDSERKGYQDGMFVMDKALLANLES